jgi:endonuclease III
MKDSKKYAKQIQVLFKKIKGPAKIQPPEYQDPMESLVFGLLTENLTIHDTEAAMKRFHECFVDLNDLRVSRTEEVFEMFGQKSDALRQSAGSVSKVLNTVFNKTNSISLESLKKIGKRQVKELLHKIDGVTDFAIDYCMLTAFEAHAIPLTGSMVDYMKNTGLAHSEATREEIQGFLAKQISADKAYEFYYLFRKHSETDKSAKKVKAVKKENIKKEDDKIQKSKSKPEKTKKTAGRKE